MTDPGPEDRDSSPGEDQALSLLKNALQDAPLPDRSLLPKIQDRIRIRTRGRYFRSRYSRSLDPIPLLLIVCLLVLLVLTAIFLVFQPLSSKPVPHSLPPAPVDPLTAPGPGP
jgi:hypothetical protein